MRTPAHGNELLTGAKTVEFDDASGLVPSAAEVEGTSSPFIFQFSTFAFCCTNFEAQPLCRDLWKTGKSRTTLCPEAVLQKRCLCYTNVGPFVKSLCPEIVHEKRTNVIPSVGV